MTSTSSALRGVFPVLQTPFAADGSIDYGTLQVEIDWLYQHQVDGLTIALASELLRLSASERREMGARTVKLGEGRGPVVISVGAESTWQAVEFARAAEGAGAAAVMAIPPLAVRCSDDELRGYFDAILDAISLPLVIQDASGYLGTELSLELQCAMLESHPQRVLFKPEAEPVGPVISALQEATGGETLVFEGSGGLNLLDNHQRGCTGTMPGAEMPWAIVRLWRELQAGNSQTARSIQAAMTSLVAMMSSSLDAFLAVEKHLLCQQGIFPNTLVRGPVGFQADQATLREVDRRFAYLKETLEGLPKLS